MLRTNLATRPFYNERLAAILVWGVTAIVLVLTLVNVLRLTSLSSRDAALRAEAAEREQRAATLRRDAQQARRQVDPAHLRRVSAAARDANALIDGRTFSWTELFNRFESTLPTGVRLASVRPARGDRGQFVVSMTVVARDVDQIDALMEALESRGGFTDVLARRESVDDEGLIEATVSGTYAPGGETAAQPTTASDPIEDGDADAAEDQP